MSSTSLACKSEPEVDFSCVSMPFTCLPPPSQARGGPSLFFNAVRTSSTSPRFAPRVSRRWIILHFHTVPTSSTSLRLSGSSLLRRRQPPRHRARGKTLLRLELWYCATRTRSSESVRRNERIGDNNGRLETRHVSSPRYVFLLFFALLMITYRYTTNDVVDERTATNTQHRRRRTTGLEHHVSSPWYSFFLCSFYLFY
jgi:hypothetical protein